MLIKKTCWWEINANSRSVQQLIENVEIKYIEKLHFTGYWLSLLYIEFWKTSKQQEVKILALYID